MTATLHDALKAEVVFVGVKLLKTPEEIRQFRDRVGFDFQVRSGTAGNRETGDFHPIEGIFLQRERIAINSLPDRAIVEKEYPSLDDPTSEWTRLAEITGLAMDCTEESTRNPRACGYNLHLVFDVNSEHETAMSVGARVLTERPLGKSGWQLVGGSGRMIFGDGNRRWTFNLQPQQVANPTNNRVNISTNLHIEESRVPTGAEIRRTLSELWGETHEFIDRVTEGGLSI